MITAGRTLGAGTSAEYPREVRKSESRSGQRDDDPKCRIAATSGDLLSAFQLIHDAYVRSALSPANDLGMRLTSFHMLETTEVFVGIVNNQVAGTISLVRDGARGIPMEVIYGDEVAARRRPGSTFAEVSCLADCRKTVKRSLPLVIRLMGIMAQAARKRGIDDLLIAVHPRHVRFYESFIGFEVFGPLKTYQMVCNNPAVALSLDLKNLHVNHPKSYQRFFGYEFPGKELEYRPWSPRLREEIALIYEMTKPNVPVEGKNAAYAELLTA
jgi:hypothetical protein